jgi:hypothetical protein
MDRPMEISGKMEFVSMFKCITMDLSGEEIDLRDVIFKVLDKLNGRKVTMDCKMNDISIYADDDSKYTMLYENKGDAILMILSKPDGMQNLGTYIPHLLQNLNGRNIVVSFSDDELTICGDQTVKTHEMWYTHDNLCRIEEPDIKTVCKPGTADACIFMSVGVNGFECMKFSHMAAIVLERKSNGTMRASRIGDCTLMGRKEETK